MEVLTDRPTERFVVGARLHPEGSASPLTIVEARPANPGWIVRFGEVRTREAADGLRLVYLEVEAGPADVLPRGAYFWHEMIGVEVHDPEGGLLGTVRDVYRTGGADVLDADGRLASMPEQVREVAALRRAIPEASLGELAAELAIPRGRVQRALERIESAALHGDDGVPDPSAGSPAAARAERHGHDGPAASM